MNYNEIDWTRVKKSPVPKDAGDDIVGWYRGSGIKIGVAAGRMFVLDADDDLIIERYGIYGDVATKTKDIKDMAKAMLNKVEMDEGMETFHLTVNLEDDQVDDTNAELERVRAEKRAVARAAGEPIPLGDALDGPTTPTDIDLAQEVKENETLLRAIADTGKIEGYDAANEAPAPKCPIQIAHIGSKFEQSPRTRLFGLMSGKMGAR